MSEGAKEMETFNVVLAMTPSGVFKQLKFEMWHFPH
jgi:hypothetical protein